MLDDPPFKGRVFFKNYECTNFKLYKGFLASFVE